MGRFETRSKIMDLRHVGNRNLAIATYLEKRIEVQDLLAAKDPSAEYEDGELQILWHAGFEQFGEAFAEAVADED